jgi:hypothetical protein
VCGDGGDVLGVGVLLAEGLDEQLGGLGGLLLCEVKCELLCEVRRDLIPE